MKNEKFQLDSLDSKILKELSQSKNKTYATLSKKLYVSLGTVHQRIKKMEQHGFIKGIKVDIDYKKLGLEITSFLGIYLEKNSMYDNVAKELTKIPEIVSIYYTTGLYSIFLKIVCTNIQDLRNILHDKIQAISGISRTETIISLEETLMRQPQIL